MPLMEGGAMTGGNVAMAMVVGGLLGVLMLFAIPVAILSDRIGSRRGVLMAAALLAATDPPYHDQLRALVSRAFTPRRVERIATGTIL